MSTELNTTPTPSAYSFAAPDQLRVDLKTDALGVRRTCPVFSWAMHSGEPGDIQTCYRILLARRREDLAKEAYLLDTGWVATDESSHIQLAGMDKLLKDNQVYWWAVQLRNRHGAESALSEPAYFSTAVGDAWEDTRGIWAPNTLDILAAELPLPDLCFLRAEFELSEVEQMAEVSHALLSITAASPEPTRQFVYHASLNGTFVGMGPARLGRDLSDGAPLLYYNTYAVKDLLRPGKNALGAVCYATTGREFLCQLTVYYKDGSSEVLLNSARDAAAFRALDGKSAFGSDGRSIGTNYFFAAAENINAPAFPFGYDTVGFDDRAWAQVVLGPDVEREDRRLAAFPGDNVGRYPQDIALVEPRGEGHWFIDLGNEVVGGLRLTLDAPAPCTIRLCFGEELNEDGSVRYKMRTTNTYEEFWTLREGPQTLENIYSLKTFRFVEIFDCPVALEESNIQAIAYRKAFDPEQSFFTCSNAVLCRLYDTYKYAICATNQDLYVDSQSRERCAYEGDALVNMLSSYTYENSMALPRFSVEYLLTHRTWPAEYALLPIHMVRLDYLYSGDRTLLERAYPRLTALLGAAAPDGETGLYPSKNKPVNGWDSILVDWPVSSRDGYAMEEAFYNTVYNATAYLCLRDMAVMAGVLGKEDDSSAYTATADALRRDMIDRLYDPTRAAFRDGLSAEGAPVDHFAQHATALALCCGIYTDDAMKDALGRTLVGQDCIRTSIYGAFFLFDALYQAGFGAYATALLADGDETPGAHSFYASLCGGLVTLAPEAWCTAEKGNMTFSHPWGTTPATMIVRGMFGIRPTRPGFHKFEVRPQIGDLPYASIRVPTVKGIIGVSVGQNREAYEVEVAVPPNTTATVYLPALPGGSDTLFVNGQRSNFPLEKGHFEIRLGAGTHRLLSQ